MAHAAGPNRAVDMRGGDYLGLPLATRVVIDTEGASTGPHATYPASVDRWVGHSREVTEFLAVYDFGTKDYHTPELENITLRSESDHAAKLSDAVFDRVNSVLQEARPEFAWSLHPSFRIAPGNIFRQHPDAG